MKNGKFESKKEASDHALCAVAVDWLKFAERVIMRGDRPAKFSVYGLELVRAELSQERYDRVRRFLNSESIFHMARQYALQSMYAGNYRVVAEHFGVRQPPSF